MVNTSNPSSRHRLHSSIPPVNAIPITESITHTPNASSGPHVVDSSSKLVSMGWLLHTLPHHNLQMPLRHRYEAIIPLHIRLRGPTVRNVEATEEVCGDEVQFRVGEIDARTRPRAPRKGHEFPLHFPRSAGGAVCEPALGLECLGVLEGARVLVVDVAAAGDGGLYRARWLADIA